MLYEAIYVPEESEPLPKEIIKESNLAKYIKDFENKGDYYLVAEEEGRLVGAVWIRLFSKDNPGYGYVDEYTPKLSIALRKEYRGLGIGQKLIKQMLKDIKDIKDKGYSQVSLSVDEDNRAFPLYKKLGFQILQSKGTSHIMIRKCNQEMD